MNHKFESRKPEQIFLSILCHMTISVGFYLAFLLVAYSKKHLWVRLEGTTAAMLHRGVRGVLSFPLDPGCRLLPAAPQCLLAMLLGTQRHSHAAGEKESSRGWQQGHEFGMWSLSRHQEWSVQPQG